MPCRASMPLRPPASRARVRTSVRRCGLVRCGIMSACTCTNTCAIMIAFRKEVQITEKHMCVSPLPGPSWHAMLD